METISLVIMAAGLVALAAIFVLSKISRKDLPQKKKLPPINTLMSDQGDETSSIMEDQPARDGKRPSENAQDFSQVLGDTSEQPPASGKNKKPPTQLIMFIAADDDNWFEGPKILEALDNAGLTFGDMDVFHRMVLTERGEKSLFNVANGINPWTLIPENLQHGESTPGLSMVLNLPTAINDSEAIHDFIRTAERITSHLGGTLKNQNQEPITAEQRQDYFAIA